MSARTILKHLYEEGRMTEAQYQKIDRNLKEPTHGKWIEQSDNYGDPYYECSVCEDAFITLEGTPKENHYNFCPNCGADMRKKEGEESERQN